MRRERICPLCGGNIERRDGTAHSDTAYGKRLSLYLSCDDPACGFGLAFPFDAEVYIARACEEIRTRTRTLPADARAEALLASLSYCRRDTDDPLSEKLSERVNVIFMEALGEIQKRARDMLRDLSYREPNV
ncbi:MAG: hypothetical protein J6B77_03450, partial [Clostridia bacterium]|nr:hypothetical protein [Clostridia bacterium]